MAEVFVKHTLNPRKVSKFNLALRNFVLKGEEAKHTWVLEIGTTTLTASGTKIPPYYVHNVTEATVEKEVEKAISHMCSLIDWSEFDEDKYPPVLSSYSPVGEDVPIKAPVNFIITDKSPSSGIDLSDMKVKLNTGGFEFDITSEVEIKGDPYEYTVSWWSPKL